MSQLMGCKSLGLSETYVDHLAGVRAAACNSLTSGVYAFGLFLKDSVPLC